jgi:crossover junction endodeoxyribonuclease RuvC
LKVDNTPIRVMGIDPGLTRMGYGVLEESGSRVRALDCGTLRTEAGEPSARRLAVLFEALTSAIAHWQPQAIAMERLFFKLNAHTAVPAIQASGIALLVAARSGLEVQEYTPAQVKQAVVGEGAASKEQVRFMVERILGRGVAPDSADAADGLAVAITHLSFRRMSSLQAAL